MIRTKLIRTFAIAACVLFGSHSASAAVDPNFYIYLCFGQSNMEGNAQEESVDKVDVDERFQLLATCNFSSPSRTKGNWYKAVPPLVSPQGHLGPTDYFGRTMVAALPSNVRVGVIPVAMGGSPIEMFDKDQYQQKMKDNPGALWTDLAKQHYGGNPYKRLIDMAKKAQEVGVIKGILLHQGCSNNGDPNWPNMVKKIYDDILKDLGLNAADIPLFVGETLRKENGSDACYMHNEQVAKMPSVISNSYVISSEGCDGNHTDPWHFCAEGYRILGKRYAQAALKVLGVDMKADADYQFGSTLKKFYTVKKLEITDNLMTVPGYLQRIPATAVYEDGHKESVDKDMTYRCDDIVFNGSVMQPTKEVSTTAEAIYTDFTRKEISATIHIDVRFFPFGKEYLTLQSSTGKLTYDEANRSVTLTAGAQAGWFYKNGANMSDYKFLVLKLKEPQTSNAEVRVYRTASVNGTPYKEKIEDRTTVAIDLNKMIYNKSGSKVDPAKVYIVDFYSQKAGTLLIDDVFLSNDDQYAAYSTDINTVNSDDIDADNTIYTLDGRDVSNQALRPGVYIKDGKTITIK